MALDDHQVSITELHTLTTPYKGEKYFKPLPNYPESTAIKERGKGDESNEALMSRWTDELQDDYNTRPHHPNSDIYYRSSYRGQIEANYDGNLREFLAETNPDNWFSMNDFISMKNLNENPWFSGGGQSCVLTGSGSIGRVFEWDMSSYDFLFGMVKNKVTFADKVKSKHYVGKLGEKSRIFDRVNGYYGVAVEDSSSFSQLNAFTMKFLQKLNTEKDYIELREFNPKTGKKLLPNQEQLQYRFENQEDIYHNKLLYRLLVEIERPLEVEYDLDLDLIIQYFMAVEKRQHGNIKSPTQCMGVVQRYFSKEPYKSALIGVDITRAQLSEIITSPHTEGLYEEVNAWSDDELQKFIDENKNAVEVELEFEKTEEYIMENIKIADILSKVTDWKAQKSLEDSRPPISAKDKGGRVIAQLLETLTIGEKSYIIKITNDPMEVLLSNTSQEWGLRQGMRWDDTRLRGYVSCINYNGPFSAGPFFDFYNGNGVAYVAEVNADAYNSYKLNMDEGEENEFSPEELFYSTESKILGRFSLRWGVKRDREGGKIGWGIGLETTAYPKSQTWAEGAFISVANILKQVKDNKGNSIWDYTRDEDGRPNNIIKAPYKMGWSYLDYNSAGYSDSIPVGDYDCKEIEGRSSELIPNYNKGLKFGLDKSSQAQQVELQEGIGVNYEDFVTYDIRDFQEISQGLIPTINMYGFLQPSIYTVVAQNPQIWISEKSFSQVINGLFRNTIQEMNHPIRKAFLELALESSTKNISWLLQPPKETLSIRENLNKYDSSEEWDMNPNSNLIKTLFNHPSILEPFIGHEPLISIQEHLYKQNFIIRDRLSGEVGYASDFYLLNLHTSINRSPIVPMDNAVLSDIIKKLKKSIKQNLKTSERPKFIYPQIDVNWNYWSNLNAMTGTLSGNMKLLLTYFQMKALINLAFNPAITEENYRNLCEMTRDIAKIVGGEMSQRQRKSLVKTYNQLYQALTFALLYNKAEINSPLYTDERVATYSVNPQLPDIGRVMDWASEILGNSHSEAVVDRGMDSQVGDLFHTFQNILTQNPYAQMSASSLQTISTNLQNTNTIRAWDSVPSGGVWASTYEEGLRDDYPNPLMADQIKKLTMFYYLYHFSNSLRTHRVLLKLYDIYLQDLIKGGYIDDSYSAYAFLFDTTVGKDGKLLPSNPYINNEGVKLIGSRFTETDLNLLRSNITLSTEDEDIRYQFNDEGLTEFIRLLLGSNLATYGYGNMLLLLRTPYQFRMAEQFILQMSLGEYFTTTKKGNYVFKVPDILNKDIDELISEGKIDILLENQEVISDIEGRLSTLSNYLTYLSKNPYIPPAIQSRLILSTKQTNAFSIKSFVHEVKGGRDKSFADNFYHRKGRNLTQVNLHYSDIFSLYKSNIYNQNKYGAIVQNLVRNPILAKTTIKQILTNMDDSLLKDFMLNSMFDFEDSELADLSPKINDILFDYGPTILTENLGISDDLRLTLFNRYLEGLFQAPQKDYSDSLLPLKEFIFNGGNFRSDSTYSQFINTLSNLNFSNVSYWRGGFGKFSLNKYIPAEMNKEGPSISEEVIRVDKPQIIVDINFKPPHSNAYTTGSPYGFLTEREWGVLVEAGEEIARLEGPIAMALDELGVESLEEAQEMVENGEEVNMVELGELEENYDLLSQARRRVSTWKAHNKQNRDDAPIDITIRYIKEREVTQRGIKLSGSYWDSSRVRVSNKWSETYPDWDAVYGYGEYGVRQEREELIGGPKFWSNQITLVFSDMNPNIGWDVTADTGVTLPKWRMDDSLCNSRGVKKILLSMIHNMKDPPNNLEAFLSYYAGFIEGSGHFKHYRRDSTIRSDKIVLLEDRRWTIPISTLSLVFSAIDSNNLWDCISYAGSDYDLYTTDPIIFILFMESLSKGPFENLKRPSQVLLLPLCQNLAFEEEYENCLTDNFSFLSWPRDELTINLGELGIIKVRHLIELFSSISYADFINTAYYLIKGLDGKIEGVENDIAIFATIFNATLNLENTRLNQVCRKILVDRAPDWVEAMREQGGVNPDAMVQEAEEYYNADNKKVNIHKERMKKYIKQILGSD